MKTLLFTLLFLSCAYSHAQDTTFSKVYENNDFSDTRHTAAAVTLDGGLISTSNVWNPNGSTALLRIASDGAILWERSIGPSAPESLYINDIIATYDTCYIVSGLVRAQSSGELHPFCAKVNDQGTVLWDKTFDFFTSVTGYYELLDNENPYLTETSDSSILIAWHHSTFVAPSNNPDHLCVAKIASNGILSWSNSILVDSTFFVADIAENSDQSIVVLGNTDFSSLSGYVIRLNEMGLFDWAKKYDDVEFDEIIVDSNGFAVSWMNLNQQVNGIMKFDSSGVNTQRIGYSSSSSISDVHPSFDRRENGNYIFSQRGDEFGGGSFLEVDDALTIVGSHSINMLVQTVRSIPGYGAYAVGYGPLYGLKSDYNEVAVVRFDSLMNSNQFCTSPEQLSIYDDTTITGQSVFFTNSDSLAEIFAQIDDELTSSTVQDGCVTFLGSVDEHEGSWNETVSPNPSTGEFTISWEEYRDVEVVIYNSIGTEIYRTSAKNSFVEFDLNAQSEGLFYYQLLDQDGSQSSGKLMVLK